MSKGGRPIAKKIKKYPLTVKVTELTRGRLDEICEKFGYTKSDYTLNALNEKLKNEKGE